MEENSNKKIKNAFLTLCGYDVFDLMKTNFKRLAGSCTERTELLDEYIEAKEELEKEKNLLYGLKSMHEKRNETLITCVSA